MVQASLQISIRSTVHANFAWISFDDFIIFDEGNITFLADLLDFIYNKDECSQNIHLDSDPMYRCKTASRDLLIIITILATFLDTLSLCFIKYLSWYNNECPILGKSLS